MVALPTILMAEDDPDDQLLIRDAVEESSFDADLRFVNDGEELLEYLRKAISTEKSHPRPRLIFLDLNMPRKDGREALIEIKQHPELRRIPVVILTTSANPEDVKQSYEQGASSYVTKPASYDELVELMSTLGHYWFSTVSLPNNYD